MGKRLTDREVRAILKREAEADPDSWAADVIAARTAAQASLTAASKQPGSPFLSRAIRDIGHAEKLERDAVTRYLEPAPKNTKPKNQPEPEALPDTEKALRDQLRTEHKAPEDTNSVTEAHNTGEGNGDPRSLARAQDRTPVAT